MSRKVSVIIPAYNYAHYLDECLDSVFRQNYAGKLEVIVVDDGSVDNTQDVLKKHSARIMYIYQENKGLSAARNTGVRHSTGEYIQFLDADDILCDHCLNLKVKSMSQLPPFSIGVCSARMFGDSSGADRVFGIKMPWMLYERNLELHLCRLNIAPPHSFILPRNVFDRIGFFDESFSGCEDYDFWLKGLGAGYKFFYFKSPVVGYRQHQVSMASKKRSLGAFPFDVVVHEKKYNDEYGVGVTDLLEGSAGCLALANGALQTAFRIDSNVNESGRLKLADMAEVKIQNFLDNAQFEKLSIEGRLYLCRLLSMADRINEFEHYGLQTTFENMCAQTGGVVARLMDMGSAWPFFRYEQKALAATALRAMIR